MDRAAQLHARQRLGNYLRKTIWLGSYAALFVLKFALKMGWIDHGVPRRLRMRLLLHRSVANQQSAI
jgi:hypothetical protein